jgi:hypothetical protein
VDEIKTSLDQQDKFRRKKQSIEKTKDLSRRKETNITISK